MEKLIILGGGASGMMAAIKAKENNPNLEVVIIEKNDRVGKKILLTGNGRCNISNDVIGKSVSNQYNHQHINQIFSNKNNAQIVYNEFKKLGLEIVNDNGYYYPFSYSANSVLDALRLKYLSLGVKEICGTEIISITKINSFILKDSNGKSYDCKYLVIATGGIQNGKKLLSGFGISYTTTLPGLGPLPCNKEDIVGLSGLRINSEVSLYIDNQKVYQEFGEVLFKNDRISGIVIFNISTIINRHILLNETTSLAVKLNFNYQNNIDLVNRIKLFANYKCSELFTGLFSKMIGLLILSRAGVDKNILVKDLQDYQIEKIDNIINNFTIEVFPNTDYSNSQVTIGGVKLEEINNFQSRKVSNLFIIGEALDIDGICGGFNLHFAFFSGIVVGSRIGNYE